MFGEAKCLAKPNVRRSHQLQNDVIFSRRSTNIKKNYNALVHASNVLLHTYEAFVSVYLLCVAQSFHQCIFALRRTQLSFNAKAGAKQHTAIHI